MHRSAQRPFLPATTSTPGSLPPGPHRAPAVHTCSTAGAPIASVRLEDNWEHRATPADGIWQIWSAADQSLWSPAPAPLAAPGWYRTRLVLRNPIANGRTILHFHAAAHPTTLWVGPILIGTRKPDSAGPHCVFDITDALARLAPSAIRHGIPLAVLFENPTPTPCPIQDSSTVISGSAPTPAPTTVDLVYLPALALDHIQLRPRLTHDGVTRLSVSARLYNPTDRFSACTASIEILDSTGHILHSRNHIIDIWNGLKELANLRLASGAFRCRITLSSPEGQTCLEEAVAIPPRRLRAPHDHATQRGALSWA